MPPCQSRPKALASEQGSRRRTFPMLYIRIYWSNCEWYRANVLGSRLSENKPLLNALSLGGSDSMKIVLTTKEGSSAKMPHQAFLLLKDTDTGLDYSYPFNVKDSGKSKVELVRHRGGRTAKRR